MGVVQMTEHKFTDEQIIEAIEIRMPHDAICREAYYLINRYKAEIEDLEIKNEHLVCFLAEAREDAIKEFAERLKEKIRVMDRIIIYGEDIDNLVKEMTEGKGYAEIY
jgi:hypothetical protein